MAGEYRYYVSASETSSCRGTLYVDYSSGNWFYGMLQVATTSAGLSFTHNLLTTYETEAWCNSLVNPPGLYCESCGWLVKK